MTSGNITVIKTSGNIRKSHARHSNVLFHRVWIEYEKCSGDTDNKDFVNMIDIHFRWEQITYVMPFQNVSTTKQAHEWRLMYRLKEGMEYHHHIKVGESNLHQAGYGLFADRTFHCGDLISVYIGDVVRTNQSHRSAYAIEFKGIGDIDAKFRISDGAKLFLGCHFVNDKSYENCITDNRKKYNSKFEDLSLISTSILRKNTEILVDYNIQNK